MKPDPAERKGEADLEGKDISSRQRIYVAVALVGCAVLVWLLLRIVS